MDIERLVADAAARGTSDIHVVCGVPVKLRINGQLQDADDHILTDEDCEAVGKALAGKDYESIAHKGELDLAATIAGHRVRINLFRQQGNLSAAIRILNDRIPDISVLGLPPVVEQFSTWQKGIILVTGETGSGKSTTLAAILDKINHTRREHIITLEDPIEYIYKPDMCLINQREIGKDTASYAEGLRAILREDPDVILIGEMRDLETIETALTAAETGHLVFATLHTNSAVDSIDRIVDVFPAERQQQIRLQLSGCLRAVLAQQLLLKKDGSGRVAACEVMVVTNALKNLIREGKTPQMTSAMLSSAKEGSITMDNFLIKLVQTGVISREMAINAANDKSYLTRSGM